MEQPYKVENTIGRVKQVDKATRKTQTHVEKQQEHSIQHKTIKREIRQLN